MNKIFLTIVYIVTLIVSAFMTFGCASDSPNQTIYTLYPDSYQMDYSQDSYILAREKNEDTIP